MRQFHQLVSTLYPGLGAAFVCAMLIVPAEAIRPKLPPAGDCSAMAAGSSGTIWFGRFSGRYEDTFRDGFYYPVAASGCFRSEKSCRRWTNQMLSITSTSALMSCRPYGEAN